MSDTDAATADPQAGASLPKVVVIVRGGDSKSPTASVPRPELKKTQPTAAPAAVMPDEELDEAAAARAAEAYRNSSNGLYELVAPTKVSEPRERTGEDDVLVGAVVQLDLSSDPSPLTDFLGRTLLYRTARAAADVGAPRLILVGNIPQEQHDEVYREAYTGFRSGPVEIMEDDPGVAAFGKGRILLLDGTALHDTEAVARLARVRGEKTALLLGQHGDGNRVATNEGLITEVGADLSPYDGIVAGACSTTVEEFELLTRLGEKSAMRHLAQAERLIGTVVSETHSRQFRSADRIRRAQIECFGALASSGNEGVFEDLVGRPFSRLITLKLLHSPISPNSVSVLAGVMALLGAGLLAHGHRWGILAAAVLAILSAILDRTDGELARLRLSDEEQRSLDFGLDHLTHALLFLGLAYGVHDPANGVGGWAVTQGVMPEGLKSLIQTQSVSALTLGFLAAGGVLLLMAVMIWRGPPSPHSRGMRKVGDAVASYFGSRDHFYLLAIVAALNVIPPLSLSYGVLGWFLLATTILIHASWILLLLVSLAAPRPRS